MFFFVFPLSSSLFSFCSVFLNRKRIKKVAITDQLPHPPPPLCHFTTQAKNSESKHRLKADPDSAALFKEFLKSLDKVLSVMLWTSVCSFSCRWSVQQIDRCCCLSPTKSRLRGESISQLLAQIQKILLVFPIDFALCYLLHVELWWNAFPRFDFFCHHFRPASVQNIKHYIFSCTSLGLDLIF